MDLGVEMTDKTPPDRPVAIQISGNARGNTFTNVRITGDTDAVRITDEATDNKFENLTHARHNRSSKSAVRWWEHPKGIVLLMVVSGLIVAALAYLFGWS